MTKCIEMRAHASDLSQDILAQVAPSLDPEASTWWQSFWRSWRLQVRLQVVNSPLTQPSYRSMRYSMILNTSRHLQLYCPKCAIRLRHLRPKLSFQIARWTWGLHCQHACSTHRRHVGHALLRNLLDFSTLRTTQNLKTSKRWAQVVWTLICSVRGAAWVWSAASLETS